jgi:hypothetical protein
LQIVSEEAKEGIWGMMVVPEAPGGNLISLLVRNDTYSGCNLTKLRNEKKKLPVAHRSVAWKPGFSSQFG